MEKTNTALFPLAAKLGAVPAPPIKAKAPLVVTLENKVPSEAVVFTVEPLKALSSVLVKPVAGTNQLEDPKLPSKYKEPVPKFAV